MMAALRLRIRYFIIRIVRSEGLKSLDDEMELERSQRLNESNHSVLLIVYRKEELRKKDTESRC
jgi:hypothetical protein